MSTIPAWNGAQVGYGLEAGQTNQFVTDHNTLFQFSGQSIASQEATGTGVYIDTLNQWLSQAIVTGATETEIGGVGLQLSTIGGSPTLTLIPALTVSLYADLGGTPTGPALASATVTSQFVYSSSFWVQIPLIASGLTTSTTYHLVTAITGTTGHYYVWQKSPLISGALTSLDGNTWVTQNFGLMYQVYTQDGSTGLLSAIYEDGGNVTTTFTYNSFNQISTITQYALLQDGSTILSSGTLSYTNGLLVGVS